MTEEKQELRKCSSCRCEILLETYFSKNRKGEYKRTCNPCREKKKKYNVKCEVDGCDFQSSASHLKTHSKIHTKIRDIKCTECEQTFYSSSNFNRHYKSTHTTIKDFKCGHCDFTCTGSDILYSHEKMVHLKLKNQKCDKCDYTTSSLSNLTRHIKMVHSKINDKKCDKCEYICSDMGNLNRHSKKCTGNLNISSGELACRKALELLGIEYETEVSEIKNNEDNWLKWDFKITLDDKPAYIEYDGQAHYKPVCFGGMSKSQAKENLKKLQEHDQIKNEYCKKNNYPLLRIPYFRFEEVMELIREFVQSSSSSETS